MQDAFNRILRDRALDLTSSQTPIIAPPYDTDSASKCDIVDGYFEDE